MNNPPYTIFQAEDGRWGTKDADGNVEDNPIYQRIVRDDGSVTFFDGYTTVCVFSPEEGMELLAWYQPWWEDAFCWAKYPEEFNPILWENIRANRDIEDIDRSIFTDAMENLALTDEQRQAIGNLDFYARFRALPKDADDYAFEEAWFSSLSRQLTPQQLVDCLVPLMHSDCLAPEMKSAIWYANFCFIDTFQERLFTVRKP